LSVREWEIKEGIGGEKNEKGRKGKGRGKMKRKEGKEDNPTFLPGLTPIIYTMNLWVKQYQSETEH